MNRSLTCILPAVLIAGLVCAVLMPVVSAGVVIQTTTSGGLKPSSCYSAPKYPVPDYEMVSAGAAAVHISGLPMFDGPPYSIQFRDLTPAPATGQTIASRYWNFGDGATSTEKNPVHTYAGPGNYSALLSVTTICGSQYTKKVPFYVNTFCTDPVPGFTVDVSEGSAPLTVHVTDTSQRTPAEVTTWTYGYGSSTTREDERTVRHEMNPVFTFSTPGTYTITQTISKSCAEPDLMAGQKYNILTAEVRVKPYAGYAVPGDNVFWETATTATVAPGLTTATAPAPQEPASAGTPAAPAPASAAGTLPQGTTGAAAPSISPGTGTLAVVTDPVGAEVYVDDVLRGASPASVPGLTAGSHMLRLEKTGYRIMKVPVDISDGKTTDYSTALVPETSGKKTPLGAATVIIALGSAGMLVYRKREKSR